MIYYDREGRRISMAEWGALLGWDYQRVARTAVGPWLVSTVWLGIDHNWGHHGPPVIFETMVFDSGTLDDELTARYSTEADALAGHEAVVRLVELDTELVRSLERGDHGDDPRDHAHPEPDAGHED